MIKPSILDTDILSEFLRGNDKVIANVQDHLETHGFLCITVITYYEVLNGLLYKDAKSQLKKFEAFADLCQILPLTQAMAKTAANIQAQLRKTGKEIGHTDTLIAGIALTSGLQLVTNNTKHFKRVKGLSVSNWMK